MFLGIVKIALKGCKSYYGSFVSILVVFEAETGFSVLFYIADSKNEEAEMRRIY